MEKHCKICNRRFANGKAMGGHMRSHLAKLPIPPKPNLNPPPVNDNYQTTERTLVSSSSSMSIQNYRSLNHKIFSDLDNHCGRESDDNESSQRNLIKRRSKRLPKRMNYSPTTTTPPEPDSVSSMCSDVFSDEELALCLLMLSKDKWPIERKRKRKDDEDDDEDKYNDDDEEEEEEDDEEDESFDVTNFHDAKTSTTHRRKSYKCVTCKKLFDSYQALGGHIASHKKIKIHAVGAVGLGRRKCPFCDKVFESGQALGGHKKVHYSYLGIAFHRHQQQQQRHVKSDDDDGDNNLFDLNLPAPEDDSEVSQV